MPEGFILLDPPLGVSCFDEIIKELKQIPNIKVYRVTMTFKSEYGSGHDREIIVEINSDYYNSLRKITKIMSKYSGVKEIEQLIVKK